MRQTVSQLLRPDLSTSLRKFDIQRSISTAPQIRNGGAIQPRSDSRKDLTRKVAQQHELQWIWSGSMSVVMIVLELSA